MDSITAMLMASAHWIMYGATITLAVLLCTVALLRGAFTVMSIRTWWICAVGWQIFFATVLTVAQYRMWYANDITRELVTTPLGEEVPRLLLHAPILPFLQGSSGYYVFYAYTHFWLPVLLGLIGTMVVYAIFRFLRERKPVAVGHEELMLVTGISFLAGWPNMVTFIALSFVLAFIHTFIVLVRQGAAARTRMLGAIIAAAIITLIFSATIAAYTGTLAV